MPKKRTYPTHFLQWPRFDTFDHGITWSPDVEVQNFTIKLNPWSCVLTLDYPKNCQHFRAWISFHQNL
jgi:hypothetical protein